MGTTLSPTDKSAGITLSGGNLVATNNNNTLSGVRTVDKQKAGKFYWETTCNTLIAAASGVSVSGSGVPLNVNISSPGAGNACLGLIRSGQIYWDGSAQSSLGAISPGAVVAFAVDLVKFLVWIKLINSLADWNGALASNPATNVGGTNVAVVAGVDACAFFYPYTSNESVTANFGASPFKGPVPAGFTSGWPAAVSGFTTWSTTDLANVTLSNGNLTATSTGAGFVRVADRKLAGAGKFYWEITCNQITGNSGVGFAPSATVSPTYNNTCTYMCGNGYTWVNGSLLSPSPGYGKGNVVACALDLTNNMIWFRPIPSGYWNNSATANPATGVGGMTPTDIGNAYTVSPMISLQNTNDQATVNFGDSAFVGAVPAGFTAGWSSGGITAPATNVLVTQAAIEEWVAFTGIATMLTQAAIEEWASVAIAPPPSVQARAMVMA